MADLIDRHNMIDAIETIDWYHQNKNGEMVHGANSKEDQAWYKAEDVYEAVEAVPSADSPMIKPICPFRVQRIESHTKVDEFTDKFVPCMRKRCPCYIVEADTEWCYREYLMFPLNEKAREIVDDFNNHKIY